MKSTATYWVETIKTLTESLKSCQAQNAAVYKRGIRFAERKLRTIRRRAGIYS